MSVNLDLTTISWDTLSKFAIVGGFIFTGITFFITRKRLKHSEQIKMAHDISKELANAENETLKVPNDISCQTQKKYRHIQYLNVWEWFAFLVNHNEINDKNIICHFKPALIKDYETILQSYIDLRDSDDEFKDMKTLYKKWNNGIKNQD